MSKITVVADTPIPAPQQAQVEAVLAPYDGRFVNGLPRDNQDEKTRQLLAQAEVMYIYGMSAERLRLATRLKWMHLPFVGVNRLLAVPEVAQSEITLTNARGIIARPVADQVLAFMLSFARQLRPQWEAQSRHEWFFGSMRDGGKIDQLADQTLGLIGYGEIGQHIAKRAKAFDMRVIATRTNPKPGAPYLDEALSQAELPRLLAEADFVIVTAPLTPQTAGMLGREQFAQMKPSAYLINIARGPLVRQAELVEALRAGQIAGAGLDVFEQEPLPADSPLWDLPNVLITPHTAGMFKRLEADTVAFFCQNLERYLKGEPLENVVDKERGY